jgi:outer membrane protein OmpA-like peptidoglycan-associated protein/Mg-chelatase subunit ChlD
MKTYPFLLLLTLSTLCFSGTLDKGKPKPHRIRTNIKIQSEVLLLGDTALISWNSATIVKVRNAITKTEIDNSGKIAFVPERDTILKLEFETAQKVIKKKFEIRVNPIVVTNFTLSSDTTNDESTVFVNWDVRNAQNVSISLLGDSLRKSGKQSILADSTQLIKLTAVNRNNRQITKEILLKVRIIDRLLAPPLVYKNNDAWIKWHYKLSQKVCINGINFTPHDSLCFRVANDTLFNIDVYRNNGKTDRYLYKPEIKTASIKSFIGTTECLRGSEAFLSWDAPGVKYLTLDDGKPLLPVGNLMVRPNKTTTYTLKAYNTEKELLQTSTFTIKVIEHRTFADSLRSITEVPDSLRIDFEIVQVDRSKFPNEIKLRVVAVDEQGFLVSGLSEKKYSNLFFKAISEQVNNKEVAIKSFKVTEVLNDNKVYNMGLVLDNSGSMFDEIPTLEKACCKFIKAKKDNDNMSIVKFDDKILWTKSYTNPDTLIKVFNYIGFSALGGNTALYSGADVGLQHISDSLKNDKTLILFTDGFENASFQYNDSCAITARELIIKARQKNVRIITIAYGNNLNNLLLYKVAHLTGGNYYQISSHRDIERVFGELPRINRNYYEITYKPTSNSSGLHNITLRYNNHKPFPAKNQSCYLIGDDVNVSEFSDNESTHKIDTMLTSLLITKPFVFVDADSVKHDDKDSLKTAHKTIQPKQTSLAPISMPQPVINFTFNEYDIDTLELNKKMKPYIDFLLKNPRSGIVITGHTDLRGNDKSCMSLSLHRAEAVEQYLINKGITSNRIRVLACGKKYPIWNPDKEPWKSAENRRVEVVIVR